MESIISARDIHKSFGNVAALRGVSIEVPRGAIFGLLGPNGAGKTTLIRILTTLLVPDRGTAMVAGFDVASSPARVRTMIGLAGQYAAVDENLTGLENLQMIGRLYHLSGRETERRAAHLLDIFDLKSAGTRLLKTYSGGMRRRLDLAASLIGEPQILFLDEPTTGLDIKSRMELWEVIRRLAEGGTTVLLTTQYLEEADHLAGTIAVINHGRVIAEGSPNALKSRVGGDVLEIHLAEKTRVKEAAGLLTPLGKEPPQLVEEFGQIVLPVAGGTKAVIEAIRTLDGKRIEVEDIFLRRPTLDEVFLALTGKPAEEEESPNSQQQFVA